MSSLFKSKKFAYSVLTFGLIIFTLFAIDLLSKVTAQTEHKVIFDILAAVVSITLGATVTWSLLSASREKELEQEEASVIFNEKLKVFKDFIETLGISLQDGILNKDEIRTLIMKQSLVNMNITSVVNQKAFDKVIANITQELLIEDQNGCPNYKAYGKLYNDLAGIFRAELYKTKLLVEEFPKHKNFYLISGDSREQIVYFKSFEEFISKIVPGNKIASTNRKKQLRRLIIIKPEIPLHFTLFYEYLKPIIEATNDFIIEKFRITFVRYANENVMYNPVIEYEYQGKSILRIIITNRDRIGISLFKGEEDSREIIGVEGFDGNSFTKDVIKKMIPEEKITNHIIKSVMKISKLE